MKQENFLYPALNDPTSLNAREMSKDNINGNPVKAKVGQ